MTPDSILTKRRKEQISLKHLVVWIGLYKSFERAGFEFVDRKSRNRSMVRYYTDQNILSSVPDLE